MISGTPAGSVTIGQSYAFRPSPSDPGRPDAHLSDLQPSRHGPHSATSTGQSAARLPRPTSGLVFQYRDLGVRRPATSIARGILHCGTLRPPTAAATLSWVPPTENIDGTALTDLKGYRIRYGLAAERSTPRGRRSDGGSHVHAAIESLAPAPGIWRRRLQRVGRRVRAVRPRPEDHRVGKSRKSSPAPDFISKSDKSVPGTEFRKLMCPFPDHPLPRQRGRGLRKRRMSRSIRLRHKSGHRPRL